MSGIVVGVDGSPGSQKALEVAIAEAAAHGETLRVVYAYSVSTPRQRFDEPLPANVELRQHAEDTIEAMLAQLPEGEHAVHITSEVMAVRDHNVARALVHASKGASRLVVGSRGLEGFTGLLLGSVSQQCVQHASCPVLVVPGHDERRG